MESFFSIVLFLLVLAIVWGVLLWKKYSALNNMKEWVTWSASKNNDVRCNLSLWSYIGNAQIKLNIPEQYRITSDELQHVKEILAEYQMLLTQAYYDNQLWGLKSKYVVTGEDYFMFCLYVFLCEDKFSESGLICKKIKYITYKYCKESKVLYKNVPAWNERKIKDELEAELSKSIIRDKKIVIDDRYFDDLWSKDPKGFWTEVKKEWYAQNPGKTETTGGIPFEKSCEYLEWVLSVASKWSIAQMRKELIAANKPNAETMCVFDVIERTQYYFPLIK